MKGKIAVDHLDYKEKQVKAVIGGLLALLILITPPVLVSLFSVAF